MDPFDETSVQSPCDGCKTMTDNSDLHEFEKKHYCPDCTEQRETEAKEFMALYQARARLKQRIRVVKLGDDNALYQKLKSEEREMTKKLKAYATV